MRRRLAAMYTAQAVFASVNRDANHPAVCYESACRAADATPTGVVHPTNVNEAHRVTTTLEEVTMAGNVTEITESNFQATVLGSDKPFLVDFWATWCGPCLAIAPHVEAIANEQTAKLGVGKLNIDDHPAIASQFGVRSIPTLILFKGGKPVDQIVGAVPRAKLEELVRKHS